MSSVRSLMTGLPDTPPFRLLLAAGWERFAVSQETADDLARHASERMRHLGRPDLDAQLSTQLRRSFTKMERAGSRLVFLPSAVAEGSLVPASMVASLVRGEGGGSLDPYVTQLFRDRGAAFFDALKSTVRWTTESRGRGETAGTTNHTANYLIAVPDCGRRRGVLFTTTILESTQEPLASELLEDCIALSDAMISTFAWVTPEK